MLCRVPFSLLELWEILYDPLHIFNSGELSLALLVAEKLLHQIMDRIGDVTEVLEHDLSEECVLVAGQDQLLHLVRQLSQVPEVHFVVEQA